MIIVTENHQSQKAATTDTARGLSLQIVDVAIGAKGSEKSSQSLTASQRGAGKPAPENTSASAPPHLTGVAFHSCYGYCAGLVSVCKPWTNCRTRHLKLEGNPAVSILNSFRTLKLAYAIFLATVRENSQRPSLLLSLVTIFTLPVLNFTRLVDKKLTNAAQLRKIRATAQPAIPFSFFAEIPTRSFPARLDRHFAG
jgi:hypothetical protein